MNPSEFQELKKSLINEGKIKQRYVQNNCVQGSNIFVRQGIYPMSQKKIESLIRIAQVQRYYQCNPVRFINDWFNIDLLDAQAWIVQQAWTCPNVLVLGARGFGKALDLQTNIPTPNGDKKMREIHVGDYVFASNGRPTKVINQSPVYYNHDCYQVTFSDGETIIADKDHLWETNLYGTKKVVTTEQMSKDYKKYRQRKDPSKNGYEYIYKLDICAPVQYGQKEQKIDPYILGVWLGNGCSSNGYVSVGNADLEQTSKNILRTGYKIYSVTNDNGGNKRINIRGPHNKPLKTMLRESGLLNNKHIPDEYIYGSIEQRYELIRGLMDTDGYVDKKGRCTFTQSEDHKNIIFHTRKILQSLGYRVTISHKQKKCNDKLFWCYELYFVPDKKAPVVKMKRKYDRLMQEQYVNATHKSVIDIHKVQSVPVKCIMVDDESHLYLCGQNYTITHNSTLIDLILMAKDMLFCGYWTYIASGTGSQAQQTFTTLQRLANDSIDSFMGSTCSLFLDELEIKAAQGNGFSHSSNGFNYNVYNTSCTYTLNSNIDAKRGARGNVVFDQCGFLSQEMLNVYSAFAIVNKSFKSGRDGNGNAIDPIRLKTLPMEIPNQLFYISSASSTDTKFYSLFRQFSKKMLMGDKRYFVAVITCQVPLHPTIHGKLMNPLFESTIIENELRTNPDKARREYYCQFTTDAGTKAIVKRGVIIRNQEVRKPLLCNDTGDKKFVIAYDPARSRDNSVILVGEIYDYKQVDGSTDKRMRLVNCINLVDVGKKIKSPMQTPDQVEYLKQVILKYNGGADGYENIIGVYIDAGSGGGGINISDFLMSDWKTQDGIIHRGLIDKEYSQEYVKRFPNAVDKLKLISPSKYKSDMFQAMIQLINQDKISFTAQYDNKDYLTVFDINQQESNKKKQKIIQELKKQKLNETEFEKRLNEEFYQELQTKTIKLDWEDKIALANMDALKQQVVNMVRKKRDSGKDSFELIPEKANKLHDDRAYCLALLSYALMLQRRKMIIPKKKKVLDIKNMLHIRAPKKLTKY